jgi:hypothetical protein
MREKMYHHSILPSDTSLTGCQKLLYGDCVHDSNATDDLLDDNDKGEEFYADSAYSGEPQEKIIAGTVPVF